MTDITLLGHDDVKYCSLYDDSTGGKVWRKHERQDWDGMDTFGGKMMGILGEGCWGWNCQERGNGEGHKGGLWWKRTWLRLKWRRRMQKIETTGEGKSAVATPDGKSRKKNEEPCRKRRPRWRHLTYRFIVAKRKRELWHFVSRYL